MGDVPITDVPITVKGYTVWIRKEIGRGSYGSVYPAEHNNGRKSAAKKLDLDSGKIPVKAKQQEFNAFKTLLDHSHENIVKYYDFFELESENEVWIMMEFCEHGDLNSYFRKHPGKLEDVIMKLDMMCQISSGLEYLHSNDIVHRDIKPGNILVWTNPDIPEKDIVKLADFGLCRVFGPDDLTSAMDTVCGTSHFKAPETFKATGEVDYRRDVDVFAAGLTFLAMIQPLDRNGRLFPRIEGLGENAPVLAVPIPIGQTLLDNIVNNSKKVDVVVENPDQNHTANMIRRVIRKATQVEPTWRIDASKMRSCLQQIKDNPDAEITVQVVGAPAAQLGAVPKDEPNPQGFQPAIPHSDIMQIAEKIPPSTMSKIALMYLGIEKNVVDMATQRHRQNVEEANFEILNSWVQKNPGPNAKRRLHDSLLKATKKGLISKNVYSFLK